MSAIPSGLKNSIEALKIQEHVEQVPVNNAITLDYPSPYFYAGPMRPSRPLLVFFPDGKLAITDNVEFAAISVCNPDGKVHQTLKGHEAPITGLILLLDGRLASSSLDGTIRCWDLTVGDCAIIKCSDLVVSLAQYPDGQLVGLSEKGTLQFWTPPRVLVTNSAKKPLFEANEITQSPEKTLTSTPVTPIVFSSASSTASLIQRVAPVQTASEDKGKKEWLQTRWEKIIVDTPSKRLISTVLIKPTRVDEALINDDLDYFKDNYTVDYPKKRKALEIACLCGSEKIADFLLKKLKEEFTNKKNEYLLAYASASPNQEWAKKIAKKMTESGLTMSDTVYSLANGKLIDEIVNIFKEASNKRSNTNP